MDAAARVRIANRLFGTGAGIIIGVAAGGLATNWAAAPWVVLGLGAACLLAAVVLGLRPRSDGFSGP